MALCTSPSFSLPRRLVALLLLRRRRDLTARRRTLIRPRTVNKWGDSSPIQEGSPIIHVFKAKIHVLLGMLEQKRRVFCICLPASGSAAAAPPDACWNPLSILACHCQPAHTIV